MNKKRMLFFSPFFVEGNKTIITKLLGQIKMITGLLILWQGLIAVSHCTERTCVATLKDWCASLIAYNAICEPSRQRRWKKEISACRRAPGAGCGQTLFQDLAAGNTQRAAAASVDMGRIMWYAINCIMGYWWPHCSNHQPCKTGIRSTGVNR